MTSYGKLLALVGALAAITGAGTVGYMLVEGMTWIDALYMTVITVSTVGYGEVAPLSPAGRLFTVGLIVTSVGLVLYLLSEAASVLVAGRFRELFVRNTMQNQIDRLSGHVIICGYGRFGRVVVDELRDARRPLVVVEADLAKDAELARLGIPYLIGSALSDDVLERAGLARAEAIVVATGSDPDNVFITLSVRERNPSIRIHARGETETALRRLKLAGADVVISAYQIGGSRMASSVLRPTVVDFLEISRPRSHAEVDLEEIRVEEDSALVGVSVGQLEAESRRLRIVALKRADEVIDLVPGVDRTIASGDHLVVIGERAGLDRLADLSSAPA